MLILIDGHNLIPHIPGISLSDPDDEAKLVKILQDYGRIRQKKIEVYFDQAAIGRAGVKQYSRVKVIYVQKSQTADQAIMNRLKSLAKRSRNVVVVSSDRQVQQAARAAHATVIASSDFASEWQSLMMAEPDLDTRSQPLSEGEVEMWENLFQEKQDKKKKD